MPKRMFIGGLMLALASVPAPAQYVRPVEVPTVRPVTPMPAPATPLPNLVSPTPLQTAPAIANPPTVVVPGQPPAATQGAKARPRKCWCYARNPATNTAVRTTCEIECCKGNNQDQRC